MMYKMVRIKISKWLTMTVEERDDILKRIYIYEEEETEEMLDGIAPSLRVAHIPDNASSIQSIYRNRSPNKIAFSNEISMTDEDRARNSFNLNPTINDYVGYFYQDDLEEDLTCLYDSYEYKVFRKNNYRNLLEEYEVAIHKDFVSPQYYHEVLDHILTKNPIIEGEFRNTSVTVIFETMGGDDFQGEYWFHPDMNKNKRMRQFKRIFWMRMKILTHIFILGKQF